MDGSGRKRRKTQAKYTARASASPPPPGAAHALRPVALTVAGSDPGGGAGIQADLKVFALHGVHGAAVLAALTTQGVGRPHRVHAVPASLVGDQLEAVLSMLPVRAVKTGMLHSAAVVRVVARRLRYTRIPLVVDPAMLSKGGLRLLREDGVRALRDHLLPIAALVTPNLPEAGALLGRELSNLPAMREAARALTALGAGAALVKGGHLPGRGDIVDVLCDGRDLLELPHPRRRTPHTHGTGCVLSASIAARLARGEALRAAVREAVRDLAAVLDAAAPLGAGRGAADPLLAPGFGGRIRAR